MFAATVRHPNDSPPLRHSQACACERRAVPPPGAIRSERAPGASNPRPSHPPAPAARRRRPRRPIRILPPRIGSVRSLCPAGVADRTRTPSRPGSDTYATPSAPRRPLRRPRRRMRPLRRLNSPDRSFSQTTRTGVIRGAHRVRTGSARGPHGVCTRLHGGAGLAAPPPAPVIAVVGGARDSQVAGRCGRASGGQP